MNWTSVLPAQKNRCLLLGFLVVNSIRMLVQTGLMSFVIYFHVESKEAVDDTQGHSDLDDKVSVLTITDLNFMTV